MQESQSNIIQINTTRLGIAGEHLANQLRHRGVLVSCLEPQTVRLVIHGQVTDDDLDATAKAFRGVAEHAGSTRAVS